MYTSSKYSGEQQLMPLVLTSPWSEIESKSGGIKSRQEEFGGSGEIAAAATITVKEEAVQQEILGFGGAVTDAAAMTYYELPPKERNRLIDAYFDGKGGNNLVVPAVEGPKDLS